MKRFTYLRWIAVVASTALLVALTACGGGGDSGTPVPPPAPPPLTITTASLPDGNVNQAYSATLQASGGTGTRTWSLAAGSGSLPDGLSLSATGAISGTPTVDATFNFTVQVTDSGSPQQVATRALTILVSGFTITTTSLPSGNVGVAYSQFVLATNGQQPFSWGISVPALPDGLSIDPNTGEIGGLPTTQGPFSFTVQVTDDLNDTATANLSIFIDPAPPLTITSTGLPDGAVSVPYNVTLQATGGTPPLAWSIPTGILPFGLSLNSATGTISGTPTASATESFTVQVTDSTSPAPQSTSQGLSLTIVDPAVLVRNDTINTATQLFNGTARASISPYTDPVNTTPANPDVDVYEITASTGSIVEVRICARSLTDPRCTLSATSSLDTVIEIVSDDGTPDGARFTTGCRNEGTTDGLIPAGFPGAVVDTTPDLFDDPCVNDDIDPGVVQDSKLEFQVPTGTTTFFVRVLDFRGDARPDMLYDIIISGAN